MAERAKGITIDKYCLNNDSDCNIDNNIGDKNAPTPYETTLQND
jgi:hypothetical protein